MLETIFEKILVNSIGPYVNGIDKKNLKFGVFGGDIVIEKISLKPEAIELLGLPITLKFSSIGKLIIRISLTSIASKPVEVGLEDVFVTFQPVSKEAWKYTDEQMFAQKLGLVEDLIQNYTAMLLEKAKKAAGDIQKAPEDEGMIGRLIEKIIDNIKVSVKNIHVRFENPYAERKYAMGVTLDEIDVHTTDPLGNAQFFDRSKKENKLASLHKLLKLNDLGVYWTTDSTTEMYGDYAPDKALASMRGFLENVKIRPENPNHVAARRDYIISLSAECKVIQKSKKVLGMDKPDFDVRLKVATINTHLQRPQMENVIRLLEFFNKFERFKTIEGGKRQKQVGYTSSQEKVQQGGERFKELFTKVYKFPNKDELKGKEKISAALGNESAVEEYKMLLIGLPEEEILKIVKRIVKDSERDKQLKAFDDKKQANKGFFGGWFGSNKDEVVDPAKLDEQARQRREEQAKIEKELEDALGDDEQAVEYKKRDENEKFILGLNFELEGANIYLSSLTPNGEEGVTFYLTKLGVTVSMMTSNMKVCVGLRDFGLNLRTKPIGSYDYNDTPILRRFKHWQPIETSPDIIAVQFEDNPTGRKDEMFVKVDLHKLEFIFRSLLVERLGKFFDVSVQDEDLKSQAAERLEQYQNKAVLAAAAQQMEKTVRKNVQIRLDAPMIVIPFLQNGDPNSECWTLNLGLLSVDTKKPQTEEEKYYETFMVKLQHLKFIYYPNQSFYTKIQQEKDDASLQSKLLTQDQTLSKKVFTVMENIHINVEFDQALKEYEGTLNNLRKTHMNIDANIPQINLNLKPEVYNNLLKTTEMLSAAHESHMEFVEEIYKKMNVNKIKGGPVFVQEIRFGAHAWVKYECLFSREYLYFFKTTNDYEKPYVITSLKDAQILNSDNPQETNVFIIEGKAEKTIIKTNTVQEREEWVKVINEKMTAQMILAMAAKSKLQVDFEQEAAKKKQAKEQAQTETKPKDYNVIEMTAKFEIKQIKLNVYRNDIDKLFDFQTDNFAAKVHQRASLMLVDLKLDAIESTDYLFNYTNPDLKMLMTSVPPGVNADETDEDLVEVKVCIMEKDHPDYHKTRTAMTVGVQLGYFFVNFKPGTIQQIMGMFIPPPAPGAIVEEAKAKEAQQVVYSSDQADIVMDVAVNMSTIGVRLLHKVTYLCMAELALTKTVLKIKMYSNSMQFTGSFGDLQLFDTTGYPDTVDSDVEYHKVKKYELFGAAEGVNDLIDLSFTAYDPTHPQVGSKDKIFSFVVVNVKSVKIDYLQQPILRILDYLTGQLLPSINTGEVPKITRELAEKTLGAPEFMDLKVHLESPVIILKPRPDAREYLELRFVTIEVGSKRVQDSERIKHPNLPFIYCERFVIHLSEMGMFKIKEGRGENSGKKIRKAISRNFNFEMFFEMPMFIEEYKILYETPQNKLNIANKLVGSMTPMILHLRKKDYNLVMTCINYNVAYDDLNDPMFVSDLELWMKQQSEPGTPMKISLRIQNLGLIILGDDGIPYSMINLHLLKFDMEMFENKESQINISGAELNGSFFENKNNKLKEHRLLGSLNEKDTLVIDHIVKDQVVERVARHVKEYAKHVKFLHYAQKFQLVRKLRNNNAPEPPRKKPLIYTMFMKPNGDKAMEIYVNQLRTFCHAGTFMKLADFGVMDESCNPAIPEPYKNPSPIKAKMQGVVPPIPMGSMKIEIEVDDIEIAIPPTKESSKSVSNAIAIRGDISLLMNSAPEPTLQPIVAQLKSTGKQYESASSQANEVNKIGHLGVKLKEFEIFVCDYRELLNADSFRQVRKRNLLLPLVMDFKRLTYMVPNKTQDALILCNKNDVNLEPLVFKISYNDILLVNNSAQIQLEQLPPPEDPNKPAPKKEIEISSYYESSDDEVPIERPGPDYRINESHTHAGMHRSHGPTANSPDKKPANILGDLIEVQKPQEPLAGLNLFQNITTEKVAAPGDVVIDILGDKKPQQAPKQAEVVPKVPVDKDWAKDSDDFNVKSNGIKIVLINDAEGLLVPVLEFKIAEIAAKMLMIPDCMFISGKLVLACSYFNSGPSQWEPILEKYGLDFDVAMEENPKMAVVLKTNESFKTFQINISEQMVSTLYLTMMTWKGGMDPVKTKKKTQNQAFALLQSTGKTKKFEQEDMIDFVSPYTIMNQTGYPINVQTDKTKEQLAQAGVSAIKLAKKIYHIQNNDSTQYKMEADIEEAREGKNLDEFSINTNKIKVTVLHPTLHFEEIKGIDIDRPNVMVHKLTLQGNNTATYVLVSDVRIINQKKILTLTSPYRIKNHIPDQIFDVSIESQSRDLQIILHPNETFALPIDYQDGHITIQDDSKAQVVKKTINEFFIPQHCSNELNTGSKITLVENKTLDQAKRVFKATLRPTVQLKNCCIANICYKITSENTAMSQSSQTSIHSLKPQQTKQELKTSLNNKIYLEMMLPGYNWSPKTLVHSINPKDIITSEIKLTNAQGQSLTVFLMISEESLNDSKQKAKTILFYTKTCVINETPYDLDYFYLEGNKKIKAPTHRAGVYLTTQEVQASKADLEAQQSGRINDKVIMMNETKKLIISRPDTAEISKEINVNAVGSIPAELRNTTGSSSLLELDVHISLKESDFHHKILTKVITISPRYVLINKTDYKLEIKPQVIDKVLLTLDKDIRTPLHWTAWQPLGSNKAAELKKSITIRCLDPAQEWTWSSAFDITTVGAHNFYTYNPTKTQQKYFKASVTLDGSILYVIIKEVLQADLPYRIQNDCKDLTIQVHQVVPNPLPHHTYKIAPNQAIPWAWAFPNEPKQILAQIIFNNNAIYNNPKTLKFSFYALNKDYEILVPNPGAKNAKIKVCVSVRLVKNVYTIKFYHPKSVQNLNLAIFGSLISQAIDNIINMDVHVSLHSIGISIISSIHQHTTKKKERRELLYILLQGLEINLEDSFLTNTSQIKLKHFSIDNNTVNNTSYPVLLASTNSRSPTDKRCFLEVLLTKKNISEVSFFEAIEVFLDDTSLNVDGPFIEVIIQVADNFTRIFTADDGSEEFGLIADGLYKNTKTAIKLEDQEFFESKVAWRKPELQEFQGNLFIQSLRIFPLFFNVTFQLKKLNVNENAFIALNLLTGALGSALANLDKAPISLSGVHLTDVYDSQEGITNRIIGTYKGGATGNALKVLGSLDILGNPVGLARHVGTGAADVVRKPYQGFKKGPVQGLVGIPAGIGSLVTNTVGGVFNSFGKITGSVANGVTNLTLDDKYSEVRDKIKTKKARHIGQGLMQGGESIAQGVYGGITGVVQRPVEGARENGFKGVAKGTYQGVSGLVLKPAAGLLDAFSKTCEGMKNTVLFWDKKTDEERYRQPRPFYGKDQFYRNYRQLDAEMLKALRQRKEFQNVELVSSIDLFPDEKDPTSLYILGITYGPVVYWSAKKKKIIWKFLPKDVDRIEIKQGELNIYLNKPADGIKNKFIHVKNPDQEENEFVYNKVLELKAYCP